MGGIAFGLAHPVPGSTGKVFLGLLSSQAKQALPVPSKSAEAEVRSALRVGDEREEDERNRSGRASE
ncbi:UNVERIFIED_CONTAM: hypothetical protein HHA_305230 [Hammondia hammondi]|eukprot:XP_008884799.1 hypothetical protein HHA_305230 [Hammondia hammondi]